MHVSNQSVAKSVHHEKRTVYGDDCFLLKAIGSGWAEPDDYRRIGKPKIVVWCGINSEKAKVS